MQYEHPLDKDYFVKQEKFPKQICTCQWCDSPIYSEDEKIELDIHLDGDYNFDWSNYETETICLDCQDENWIADADKPMSLNVAIRKHANGKIDNDEMTKIFSIFGIEEYF